MSPALVQLFTLLLGIVMAVVLAHYGHYRYAIWTLLIAVFVVAVELIMLAVQLG